MQLANLIVARRAQSGSGRGIRFARGGLSIRLSMMNEPESLQDSVDFQKRT